MSSPTVVLGTVELPQDAPRVRPSLDVLSSMFLVVGGVMNAVTRWALAAVIARLAAVTAKRLCLQAPE